MTIKRLTTPTHLGSEGQGGHGVHDEVDPKQLNRAQRTVSDAEHTNNGERDSNNVDSQLELQEL
jgi:hypothetical protein